MSSSTADLQCIDSIKNRHRVPSAKCVEATATSDQHKSDKNPHRREKNRLYEIEIVAEEGSKVKVHYSGYGEEYDEWKPRSEIHYIKPQFDQVDEDFSPLTELARAIKRKLLPSLSGDPDVGVYRSVLISSFARIRNSPSLRWS